MAVNFIQVSKVWESKHLYSASVMFFVDLEGTWYAVGICWSNEVHFHFIAHNKYSGKVTPMR